MTNMEKMGLNFYQALVESGDTKTRLRRVVADMRRNVDKDYEMYGKMLELHEFFLTKEVPWAEFGQDRPGVIAKNLKGRDKMISALFEVMVHESHVDELEKENELIEDS
jgi:hypothetical protein